MWLTVALGLACTKSSPDLRVPAEAWARADLVYHQAEQTWPWYPPSEQASQFFKRHTQPERVMSALDLQPGEAAADIGSGLGYFTFRMARAVGPRGTVQALDIQESSLALLQQRATRGELNPYHNVRPVLSRIDDTTLPPASVDVALMAHLDFYLADQPLPENVRMLASTAATLKPGGRLVVVQLMRDGDDPGVMVRNFEAAGLVVEHAELDIAGQTWVHVYRRPAS